MSINQLLTTFARAWWILLISALMGVLLVLGLRSLSVPEYASTSSIILSTSPASDSVDDLANAQVVARIVAKNYVNLVHSDAVLAAASEIAGEKVEASWLSAVNPEGSSMITIRFRSPDKDTVHEVVAAVASSFISTIEGESVTKFSLSSPIAAEITNAAQPATAPLPPENNRDLILGGLVGLAVGGGVAIARSHLGTKGARANSRRSRVSDH